MRSSDNLARHIEELIDLERRGGARELQEGERRRWKKLNRDLLGVPEELGEKRRFIRVRLNRPAEVLDSEAQAPARETSGIGLPSQLLSLSAGGLFVETDRQMTQGDHIALAVDLPHPEPLRLTLQGEVRWTCPQGEGRHGAGVRFVGLDERQREAIQVLIRDELMRDLELVTEKYRFYLEVSPDASMLIDQGGVVRALNEHARRSLGLAEGENVEGLLARLGITARRAFEAAFAKAVAPGQEVQAVPFEIIIGGEGSSGPARLEAGAERVLEVLLTPTRAAQVDLGVLFVARDVTHRWRLERQRRYLEERLRQADKLATLGRIAAGVAHDINNPLAWISSNLQILGSYQEALEGLVAAALGRRSPEPLSKERLEEIERELGSLLKETREGGQRIRQIALDLRSLARLEDEAPELLDVNEVLETALRMLDNQLRQRATVARDLRDVPATSSHFGKLAQVLLNLLSNAERAFESSDPRRNRITLRSRYDERADEIVITIEDNGPGIPEELQLRIFEPLFSTRSASGGTGLGLSIAQEAARDLGARLSLSSEVGRGSAFRLCLPRHEASPRKSEPSGAHTPLTRKPRLLLIDDEVLLLRSLTRYLKRHFDVIAVESVAEATAELGAGKEPRPDVVLCDVMMPDDGGPAIYQEVVGRDPAFAERFVFMTGGAFERDASSFLDGLENRVLAKPLDLPKLLACLREVAEAR